MTNSCSVRLFVGSACLWISLLAGCAGDGARPLAGGGIGAGLTGGLDAGAGRNGSGGGAGGTIGSDSGGATASGGTPGTGGILAASGGSNNSATGGRGSGGHVGSGGSGSGGSGSGGSGSGGSGSGGATGSGGSTGPNPAMCNQLATNYGNEMPNAKVCTIGLGLAQCQTRVSASLGCGSGCTTYVQTATNLNEIKGKWTAAGCDSLVSVCPAIACLAPQSGNCRVSAGARTPQCHDSPVLTATD